MPERADRPRYGRAHRTDWSPEWIASGEMSDGGRWKVALGYRAADHLDVVADFDAPDETPRASAAFRTLLPLERGHSAMVRGSADQAQLVVGLVNKGASLIQIEMADGSRRDASMIGLEQNLPVDLYVCTADLDEVPIACLRYIDRGGPERFPLGST